MYMYLTAKPSGGRLQIPLLPDRLGVRTNATTITAQIINLGEIKIPRGTSLTGYSWNGELPGEHMKNYPFVTAWQQPRLIIDILTDWMKRNQLLTFIVTGASINEDVFIETFSYEYKPNGNVGYNIALTASRGLSIKTVAGPPPQSIAASGAGVVPQKGRVTLSNPNGTAPVLSEPRTDARVIGWLAHNLSISILGAIGNYYRINYQGGVGYVLRRYITLESTSAARTKPPQPSRPSKPAQTTPDKRDIYIAKAYETIADVARKKYGSNTQASIIVNANRNVLASIAKETSSVLGKLKPGTKLVTPNSQGGGGGGSKFSVILMK